MKRIHWIIFLPLLLCLFFHPLHAAEPREVKRVLILHSEGTDNPGQQLTEQAIRSVLLANKDFDIRLYTEYLDASRFGGPMHKSAMADFLRRKYLGVEIDALITVYPWAVEFLLEERSSLFPKAPIIAAVITRRYADKLENSPARTFVTGTIVGEKITELMDDALRLRPQTKRVALVAGTSANEIYAEQGYRRGLKLYEDKVGLIDLTKLSMEETLIRVSSLAKDTLIFYSSIFKDGAGKTFAPREALERVAKASSVPVFGVLETYLGRGIVGGHLMSFTEHGKEAAAIAIKVMEGQAPGSLPFGGEKAYLSAYDWRELKRWAIPVTAVEAGSEIRFRSPSFWSAHRSAIIGAITLMVVESFLVFGLFVNFLKRRKAERSLIDSEERLTLAADSAGAGLWSLNLTEGSYWATDKARELYEFPPDEALTFDRFLDVVHPDDRDSVRQWLEAMGKSKEEGASEYRILQADGGSNGSPHRAVHAVRSRGPPIA